MVSSLWKAAADGDVAKVRELLKDASQQDIEIKDHTGVTPLIQAVKGGHLDVVRELIAKGADPKNASSQGPPETYTQDPAILQALGQANGHPTPPAPAPAPYANGTYAPESVTPTHAGGPGFDVNGGAGYPPAAYWYMPPNGVYTPYGYMPPPPPGQEGMPHPHHMPGYYTPPQPVQQPDQQGDSPSSHIPPEIARTIACRYFPMCKYGASCMFAHPQGPPQGHPNGTANPAAPPFFPGPPPNMAYPAPYDPSMMPPNGHPPSYPIPPHPYYAMPPQPQPYPPAPAPPANGAPHPPHSPVQHTNGHSPFEGGAPPPPVAYPFPSPVPVPQPAPHIAIPPNGYHPNPVVVIPGSYNNHNHSVQHSPVSPIRHRKESSVSTFAPGGGEQTVASATAESGPRPPFAPGYRRGGNFRRVSLGGTGFHAKQPCLFFPAGKCKNGNDCRFPHVRPEDNPEAFGPEGYPPQSFPQRHSNGPRPMGQYHNSRSIHGQRSFGSREESDPPRPMNGNSGFRKFPASEGYNNRPNGQFNGPANGNGPAKFVNGRGPQPPATKEKVLTPADFPSLGGNGNANGATTPVSSNFGHAGLTAAQVLKRSAPKDLNSITEGMAKVTLANGGSNGGLLTPPKEKQHQPLTTIRAESPELPDPIFPSINDTMGSPLGNKVVVAA